MYSTYSNAAHLAHVLRGIYSVAWNDGTVMNVGSVHCFVGHDRNKEIVRGERGTWRDGSSLRWTNISL